MKLSLSNIEKRYNFRDGRCRRSNGPEGPVFTAEGVCCSTSRMAVRFQSGKYSHWLLALVHSMRKPVRILKGRLG